jgi:hypothetical protein
MPLLSIIQPQSIQLSIIQPRFMPLFLPQGNLQFTNHYLSDLAHLFIKIYYNLVLVLLISLQPQSIQLSIIWA